ncbi:hypothetical protein HYR54_04870, partial [Candidatus Acetothermia bacterium]|nr:hypothetical protein [Candidatus Acetothermia bacterium]
MRTSSAITERIQRKSSQRRVVLWALLFFLLGVIPALAVHDPIDPGLFELDANIVDDVAPGGTEIPTDWGDLFSGGNPGGTPLTLPTNAISSFFAHDGFFTAGAGGHDGSTADVTFFATGTKDTLEINTGWQCTIANNPTDKDDINHVYAALFRATSATRNNHIIIYMGMERFDNTGAGEIAFWLLQDSTVGCTAPATGSANFTGTHQTGDLLVVSEFTNGGVINSVNIFEWVAGALNTTAIATGVDCDVAASTDNVCGNVNTASITSPWANKFKGGSACTSNCTVGASEFFEIGIDVTALIPSFNGCFTGILGDTRTSPSLTADLKDYALGVLSCKSTPTVTTDIHDSSHTVITSANVGSSVHDKATVSGTAGTPTGTVTFSLYNNTTCSGTAASTETVTLSSSMAESSTTTVPNTGLSYKVSYSGDTFYNSAVGPCEPLMAVKLNPTVTTDIHDSSHTVITSANVGSSIHDKATVTGSVGTPTGSVTFNLYSTQDCTGSFTTQTVTLSSGMAESSATTVPNTGLSYKVSYSGDSNYNAATSSCEPLTPVKLTPTVATEIHNSSHTVITTAPIGSSVHDKATVTGGVGTPTGSVTFNLYSTTDCTGSFTTQTVTLSSGMAESSATTVPNTGLSYQVTYSGDANYTAATSSCEPLPATKLNPTVTTDVHDSSHTVITTAPIGSSVHDKATVSGSVGTPTGSVTFNLYSTTDCTGSFTTQTVTLSSGMAESSATTVPNTGLSYQVTYSGDANYNPATSSCEPLPAVKLNPTVTTEIHDPSHAVITSALIGSSVHDKATVSGSVGTPTGSVTFNLYSTTDCTGTFTTETVTLSSGMAESSATTVPNTGLSYMVTYSGDANYNPATSSCEPLSAIKLTSTVATEIHDSSHTVITSALIGSSVHDKATVSGSGPTPTGSVTFNLYSTTDCEGSFTTQTVTLSSGMAESSATTVPNTGLSYQVTYSGDANYTGATSACEPLNGTKLVPPITTEIHNSSHTVITSAPIGSSVHDKATISGSGPTPTGSVTFNLYSTTDCTGTFTTETVTLSGGMAESSATTVPNTGLSYQVTYSGDDNYTAATSACEPLSAIKLTSSVATEIHDSSHNPITSALIGTSVHDKATVSGSGPAPTGTVTFKLYSTTDCTGSFTTQTVTLSSGMAE